MEELKIEKKIWGLYCPANYNPEKVLEMTEMDVWKTIELLGAALFWERHDKNKPWRQPGRTPDEIKDSQYALEYLVYYTRNFGVEFTREPSEEEHVENSQSFNSWYNFWKKHFENMSKQEYDEFILAKTQGKDITKYLPSKTWQEVCKEQTEKNNLVRRLVKVLHQEMDKKSE